MAVLSTKLEALNFYLGLGYSKETSAIRAIKTFYPNPGLKDWIEIAELIERSGEWANNQFYNHAINRISATSTKYT